MKKSNYIYIAGLLFGGYFQNNWTIWLSNDMMLVISLFWCLFGILFIKWKKDVAHRGNGYELIIALSCIFFLSALWPVFAYGQSFFSTLVAMRYNLLIIFYLVLMRMNPSDTDIYMALRLLSWTTILVSILIYLNPDAFMADKDALDYFLDTTKSKESSDVFVIIPPGFSYLVLFFFMQIQNIIKTSSLKDFFLLSLLMLFIVIVQNRSTLIVAIPFYIYGLLKSRIRYKQIVIVVFVAISLPLIVYIGSHLIEETQNQIENVNYNRWQAFSFFLVEFKTSIWTILFGHGVPCIGSMYLSELLYAQNTRLAYISDIGMFGTYFMYGISMIFFCYYFVWKALSRKCRSLYVKMYAVWMLLVPTIHSFAGGYSCATYFVMILFFYRVMSYSLNQSFYEKSICDNCEL